MTYQPWMFTAMEEHGYTDTKSGLINRVADYLAHTDEYDIDRDAFRRACIACGADPDSFTNDDLSKLQEKLNQLG